MGKSGRQYINFSKYSLCNIIVTSTKQINSMERREIRDGFAERDALGRTSMFQAEGKSSSIKKA